MPTKSKEFWPAYNSANRVSYPDLLPISEARYNDIAQRFTSNVYGDIQKFLKPPKGFNPLIPLRRAVYGYHFFDAVRTGEIVVQTDRKRLDDARKNVAALLDNMKDDPATFANLFYPFNDEHEFLYSVLIDFLDKADSVKLPEPKRGRRTDYAMRFFLSVLSNIFEAATGKPMTARYNDYEADVEKAYSSPALEFIRVCLPLIGKENLSISHINALLKKVISNRERIKSSPLYR